MTCSQIQEKLLDFIEKKLSDAEDNDIQMHLDMCAQCKNDFNHFMALNDMLHTTEEIEPSSDYKEKFWVKVEKKNHFLSWNSGRLIYYGIAASILILLSITLMKYYPETPPIPASGITYTAQDKEDDLLIEDMNNLIEVPASYTSSSFIITNDELQSLPVKKVPSKNTPTKNKSELDPFSFTAINKELS